MPSRVGRFVAGYPGALCGGAFTGGVLAEVHSGAMAWTAVIVTTALVCGVVEARRHVSRGLAPSDEQIGAVSRRLVIAVVFFLLGASRYRTAVQSGEVLAPPPHRPVSIRGIVIRPPLEGAAVGDVTGRARASLEVLSQAWPRPVLVFAPVSVSGIRGGDAVRVTGTVSLPVGRRNPGEPDAPWSLTVEAQLRENVQPVVLDGHHWARVVGRVRQHLYDVVSDIYETPTRGLLLSILLGDRRLLTPRLKDALLYTGTFHFLAISGLHVGLVMFAVLRVPLPPRWRLCLRLLFLVALAVLTGANPPVLRAALLFGLTLLSAGSGRCPRPLNTLGWTTLLLLAWSPRSVLEIGFQMSFVAVFALTAAHPHLRESAGEGALLQRQLKDIESRLSGTVAARRRARSRRRLSSSLRWTRSYLAVSTTAFLGTSPLVLHHFHRVHLLSPLWNLVAYPFTFMILLGGALSLGLGQIHASLARPVALVVHSLAGLMTDILERAGTVPASTLHVPSPGALVLLLSYLLLLAWIALPPSRRLASGFVLLTAACSAGLFADRAPSVWTFDNRCGGASLIATPHSEAVLIDVDPPGAAARGTRPLASAVLAVGYRELRAVAPLDPRRARAASLLSLGERLDIGEIWLSPRFQTHPAGRGTVDRLDAASAPWRTVGRGSRLRSRSPEDTVIDILYPHRGDRILERVDGRDASLVVRLTRAGRSVLFTGALGDAGIARLISRDEEITADVLVFPRGGPERRLWAELLGSVQPRHVILVRRGEPRDRKLARRIERRGIGVLATWRGGAVITEWVRRRGWVPRYWLE